MFCKEKLEFILYTKEPLELYSKSLQKPKPELYSYVLRDIKKTLKKTETPNVQKQLPGVLYLFVCLMVVCA